MLRSFLSFVLFATAVGCNRTPPADPPPAKKDIKIRAPGVEIDIERPNK